MSVRSVSMPVCSLGQVGSFFALVQHLKAWGAKAVMGFLDSETLLQNKSKTLT